MGTDTGIEWTDATWNPIRGCTRVSQGCVNCYAERVAHRFSQPGHPYHGLTTDKGRWNGTVRLVPEHLDDPLRWKKPRRVFVNSMSDLFHEGLDNTTIAGIFGVMAASPRHTFQVLTKRAAAMCGWFAWVDQVTLPDWSEDYFCAQRATDLGSMALGKRSWFDRDRTKSWPLPNVWLGVSVENAEAKDRIDFLRNTPAAVRFLSIEPLIGPLGKLDLRGIHWVIVGGESGPGARPMHPEWVESIARQCVVAGVPLFFKQWGEWSPTGDLSDIQCAIDARGRVAQGEGGTFPSAHDFPLGSMSSDGWCAMYRVGKRRAGHLVEGREVRAFPVPS